MESEGSENKRFSTLQEPLINENPLIVQDRKAHAESFDGMESGVEQKDIPTISCCGRQVARKKCGYCVGIGIFLFLLVFLPIRYVAVPNFAQGLIDESSIVLTDVFLTNPKTSSLSARLDAVVICDSPMVATIEPTEVELLFDGRVMATTVLNAVDVIPLQDSHISQMSEMKIVDFDVFDAFSKELVMKENATWQIRGNVSISKRILGVKFYVNGLTLDKLVIVQGMAGLKNINIMSFDMGPPDPETNWPTAVSVVEIYNPSIVSIDPAGDLNFRLYYQDVAVGVLKVDNSQMKRGNNRLNSTGIVNPQNISVAEKLFTEYLGGVYVPLVARGGEPHTSTVKIYNEALKQLELHGKLTPLNAQLGRAGLLDVVSLSVFWDLLTKGKLNVPTSLALYNPLDTPIEVLGISLMLSYKDHHVATIAEDMSLEPMLLQAKFTEYAKPVTTTFKINADLVGAFIDTIKEGSVPVDYVGSFKFRLGRLEASADVVGTDVPVCMKSKSSKCDEAISG